MMSGLVSLGVAVTLLAVVVAVLWYQMGELKKKLAVVDSPLPLPIMGETVRLMEVGVGIRMVTDQLRQDAWKFAEWLFNQVGPYYGSDELGWIIRRGRENSSIEIVFRHGSWYGVTVGKSDETIRWAEELAKALAGLEGQRLLESLERTKTDRQTMVGTIRTAIQENTTSAPA